MFAFTIINWPPQVNSDLTINNIFPITRDQFKMEKDLNNISFTITNKNVQSKFYYPATGVSNNCYETLNQEIMKIQQSLPEQDLANQFSTALSTRDDGVGVIEQGIDVAVESELSQSNFGENQFSWLEFYDRERPMSYEDMKTRYRDSRSNEELIKRKSEYTVKKPYR